MPKKKIECASFQIAWPSTGGDNKLVGTYIPRQQADRLSILALYKKTTASQLIRRAVVTLLEEEDSEAKIIDTLVKMALKEWQELLEANSEQQGWWEREDKIARLREYEQMMRLSLLKRGIADSYITRIVREFGLRRGEL